MRVNFHMYQVCRTKLVVLLDVVSFTNFRSSWVTAVSRELSWMFSGPKPEKVVSTTGDLLVTEELPSSSFSIAQTCNRPPVTPESLIAGLASSMNFGLTLSVQTLSFSGDVGVATKHGETVRVVSKPSVRKVKVNASLLPLLLAAGYPY